MPRQKPIEPNVLPVAYRIDDAARALGLSRSSIYEMVSHGRLTAVKIAGRTLIPATEIRRIVDQAIVEAKAGR
jgi:excisionase family DNA binding protein